MECREGFAHGGEHSVRLFRNEEGKVKVRILHNEHDARLPLPGAPYYDWEEFRDYCGALCR